MNCEIQHDFSVENVVECIKRYKKSIRLNATDRFNRAYARGMFEAASDFTDFFIAAGIIKKESSFPGWDDFLPEPNQNVKSAEYEIQRQTSRKLMETYAESANIPSVRTATATIGYIAS